MRQLGGEEFQTITKSLGSNCYKSLNKIQDCIYNPSLLSVVSIPWLKKMGYFFSPHCLLSLSLSSYLFQLDGCGHESVNTLPSLLIMTLVAGQVVPSGQLKTQQTQHWLIWMKTRGYESDRGREREGRGRDRDRENWGQESRGFVFVLGQFLCLLWTGNPPIILTFLFELM